MDVYGLPLESLRTRTSEKWTSFPDDVLPMPVAEMDFELPQSVKDVMIAMVQNSDTGYMGNTDEYVANFATFAKKRWNWEIDSNQFYLCPDVGVGCIEFARLIVKPGDHIMVNSPVYLNMFNWVKELQCHVYDAPMKRDGMEYTLDIAAIEAGYKAGVKIHFFCNPQNPTGSVHSRADLKAIAELAKRYGVYVFSDEIHAPLTFDEATFIPFLSVSDAAREIGVCINSASKAWNLAGLKCAFIVTQSDAVNALAKQLPFALRYRASLFGARAGAAAWLAEEWLDGAMKTLDENRHFVAEQLKAKLPKAHYRIPNCSYLAWIDLSDYELEENPAIQILTKGRLAVTPGYMFGEGCKPIIRLNFATSKEIITEGIDRLVQAIS